MMQCKDAIHSLDPWELRHATNLGSCSGLRDATGGIAEGGGDVVYLVFLSPVPDICVCLYYFLFLLSRYSEPISGVY